MESVKQQRFVQSSALNLCTKFLLSVSFFSLALPIFLHYSKFQFQFQFHTIQLFSYKNDKNYMFLLCNGILVLIVKNAGLMGAKKSREERSELPEIKAFVAEGKVGVQEEQQIEERSLVKVKEAECSGSMVIEAEFKEQRNEIAVFDEDEEDGSGLLTAEELKIKCDEFIRKMKQEIKFEAQALIMV